MFGPACRICGCTEDDCRLCYNKTGGPCHWVEEDLCSACSEYQGKYRHTVMCKFQDRMGMKHYMTGNSWLTPGQELEALNLIFSQALELTGFKEATIIKIEFDKEE